MNFSLINISGLNNRFKYYIQFDHNDDFKPLKIEIPELNIDFKTIQNKYFNINDEEIINYRFHIINFEYKIKKFILRFKNNVYIINNLNEINKFNENTQIIYDLQCKFLIDYDVEYADIIHELYLQHVLMHRDIYYDFYKSNEFYNVNIDMNNLIYFKLNRQVKPIKQVEPVKPVKLDKLRLMKDQTKCIDMQFKLKKEIEKHEHERYELTQEIEKHKQIELKLKKEIEKYKYLEDYIEKLVDKFD